jgi:hypothetical protein
MDGGVCVSSWFSVMFSVCAQIEVPSAQPPSHVMSGLGSEAAMTLSASITH